MPDLTVRRVALYLAESFLGGALIGVLVAAAGWANDQRRPRPQHPTSTWSTT